MVAWVVSFADRLDVFLAADGRTLSRARAQQAIDAGRVSVNDKVVTKASFRLQEGDKVSLEEEAEQPETSIEPVDLSLEVLYEDDACMVINKPAGIAVHPGAGMAPGEKTILHGVAFLFAHRKIPFTSEAVLVHRLDRETTGCLLIAKTPAAHLALQEQFQTRTIGKQYLAFVAGIPAQSEALIDAPIGRSTSNRTTMAVRGSADAREAQTSYRIVASGKQVALLLCDLHTGRTHQVRVHLRAIGHPVLGDGTYASEQSQRLAEEFGIRSLALHAWKLKFSSPADAKEHPVVAPLPSSFERALENAGISWQG